MTDGSVFDLPVLAASRWMFTCYAILGDDGSVVMVDAGLPSSAQGALNSLRGAGRQPEDVTAVLATHGHSDHVGGMSTVLDQTAARALLPERCRHYLEGETPRNFGVDANVRFLPMMGQHPFKRPRCASLPKWAAPMVTVGAPRLPCRSFRPGTLPTATRCPARPAGP